jgi:hypothetical protein
VVSNDKLIKRVAYMQEFFQSFLSGSSSNFISSNDSALIESIPLLPQPLSIQAEGQALSTALNMAHLPTEVASINEMGEEIDSFDKLPMLSLETKTSGRTWLTGCTSCASVNSEAEDQQSERKASC